MVNLKEGFIRFGDEILSGIGIIGFFGFLYLQSVQLEHEKAEKAKVAISRNAMCDYFSGKLQTVPRINILKMQESEMYSSLKGFHFMLECTQEEFDFKKFKDQHKKICQDIKQGIINAGNKKISPWLLPFYNDLKSKVCKAEIPEGKEFDYLRELKVVFEGDLYKNKYPIMSDDKPLKDVCMEGLATVSENVEDLQILMDYVISLKFQGKLKNSGALDQIFEKMIEKNAIKNQDVLVKKVNGNIEFIKTMIPLSGFACDRDKAQALIKENLSKSVPVLMELIEIVMNDNSEKGKKLQKILANVIFGLEAR
jgi:hypothetical protein